MNDEECIDSWRKAYIIKLEKENAELKETILTMTAEIEANNKKLASLNTDEISRALVFYRHYKIHETSCADLGFKIRCSICNKTADEIYERKKGAKTQGR